MPLEFTLDGGAAATAALGVIVLQADESLEPEWRQLRLGEGVTVYHSRIPSSEEVTPETLSKMADTLPAAAALLPRAAGLRSIAYACTSGATVIGPDRVQALVAQHHPGVPCTNPLTATIAGCRALGVSRLALLTPYVKAVNTALLDHLSVNGLNVTAFASFEQKDEAVVARISEQSVQSALLAFDSAQCDAVFTSCTNLRSFSIIENTEAALGVPVLSSNLALAWHALQLAGLSTKGRGPGRLFANATL